jgi:VanZ family protein
VEFAALGLTLSRALAGGLRRPVGRRVAAWTVASGAVFGIMDEFHQSFIPFRDASMKDVAADTVGTASGLAAGVLISRWLARPAGPARARRSV